MICTHKIVNNMFLEVYYNHHYSNFNNIKIWKAFKIDEGFNWCGIKNFYSPREREMWKMIHDLFIYIYIYIYLLF